MNEIIRCGVSMKLLKKFALNTCVLVITSVFMRLVSMLFNVWLTKSIGSAGMGLFSLVLSVYSLGITFASSGINLAATRLVSEELASNSRFGAINAVKKCIVYSLIFGSCGFLMLFFGAEHIATNWLCDSRAALSLKILAVALPFISLSSVFVGYFSAVRRVVKNAVTSILEQFLRIFVTVILISLLSKKDVEGATAAVSVGIVLSELLSFITSLVLYLSDIKHHREESTARPSSKITVRLLKMTVPVALSAYVRSALMTLEDILIPSRLSENGLDRQTALSTYGIITGMVFPIIFFPLAFLSAASSLLIPELTRCKARSEKRRINYIVNRYFRFCIIFSVAVSGLFIYFSDLLGVMIYDSASSGRHIKIFAALIPVSYLDNSVDAMLKGLGEQFSSMKYNIIDALSGVILVYFLLPPLGVGGYVITVFACELLNFSLSLKRLSEITVLDFKPSAWVISPVLGIIGATGLCTLIFNVLNISYHYDIVSVCVSSAICFILYYSFLRLTNCVTDEDEKWFLQIFEKK